jgi:hypothetical protein
MTRYVAIAALVTLASAGCASGDSGSKATKKSSSRASVNPEDGPLHTTRWPAGAIPSGVLLRDDGQHLWAITLTGKRMLLWRHTRVHVDDIAASPGGRMLALSVSPNRPAVSAKDVSSFLYLLAGDGRVQLIDSVREYGTITSPIFLRAPTDPSRHIRLYWIRAREDFVHTTGRPMREVLVLDAGKPRVVTMALRYNEGPDMISGYPGSSLFSVTLLRRDNLPTRLEVLRNNDFAQLPNTSLTFWTQFVSIADTDVFTGVAWVSPREYVVPVAHRSYPGTYSLRLFRVTCEYYGWHRVYTGKGIDWGYTETPWPLLPAGPDSVLVLGAAGAKNVAEGRAKSTPWLRVNTKTREITPTGAHWSPGGWWTFVQPAAASGPPRSSADAGCGKYAWQYRA